MCIGMSTERLFQAAGPATLKAHPTTENSGFSFTCLLSRVFFGTNKVTD